MSKEQRNTWTREQLSDKADEMAMLLVESWDALAAVVKQHHLRLHNISPSLVERIKTAIEPWKKEE
jgi:hypothetical protein